MLENTGTLRNIHRFIKSLLCLFVASFRLLLIALLQEIYFLFDNTQGI